MPNQSYRHRRLAYLAAKIEQTHIIEELLEPGLVELCQIAQMLQVDEQELCACHLFGIFPEGPCSPNMIMALMLCGTSVPQEQAMIMGYVSMADVEVDFLRTMYSIVASRRYMEPRPTVIRAPDRLEWLLLRIDDNRFRQEARMSRQSFFALVAAIKGHQGFSSTSQAPQQPVELQLLVALRRFGMSGNGASVGIIARNFCISEGSVIKVFDKHDLIR